MDGGTEPVRPLSESGRGPLCATKLVMMTSFVHSNWYSGSLSKRDAKKDTRCHHEVIISSMCMYGNESKCIIDQRCSFIRPSIYPSILRSILPFIHPSIHPFR